MLEVLANLDLGYPKTQRVYVGPLLFSKCQICHCRLSGFSQVTKQPFFPSVEKTADLLLENLMEREKETVLFASTNVIHRTRK